MRVKRRKDEAMRHKMDDNITARFTSPQSSFGISWFALALSERIYCLLLHLGCCLSRNGTPRLRLSVKEEKHTIVFKPS